MITDFNELMTADSKERSKLSKKELLDAISKYSFYYKNNIEEVKSAKDALVTQSKNEEAVKSLLKGYLGLPSKEKDCNGYEYNIEYSLLDLVGKLLASN